VSGLTSLHVIGLNNMCLSCSVNDICSVEYWCDLEISVRGRLRSIEMVPLDKSRTSSYSLCIVTVAVSCIIFEIKRDIG